MRNPAMKRVESWLKFAVLPPIGAAVIRGLGRSMCIETKGQESIDALYQTGKRVIIAAHGNSIRALVKYLDNISESEITELNIPTGLPLVYELDEEMKPIKNYYLGDPEEAAKKAAAVANQAKAK